jgi:hypothetical protein
MKSLLTIDRRFIFLLVLAAVVAGTLFPEKLQLPIKTSKPVRGIYEAVEKLPAGSPVMVAMDFDPSSAPELEPMARAVLRQCFQKRLHAIGMTHWNTGLALAEQILRETAMEFDDVTLEAVPAPSREVATDAIDVLKQAKSPEQETAVLRLLAFGDGAESAKLLKGAAAHHGAPAAAEVAAASAGAAVPSGLAALLEAAAKIPAEKALPRRKVNFGRDEIALDPKYKARDLLWHAPAGRVAAEPVPVVNAQRDVTGYEVVRVASRAATLAYGQDYCFLGFKAGGAILMISMGQNLYAAFPTDKYNTPTRELPILKDVASLADLKYLVELAAGNTGEQWIVYGSERYGFPMGIGCTAVIAPDLYPYYGSRQITGIAGGIKGAWEYETLVGVPDRATEAAPVQTVAHLLVIALILFCNVAFFAGRLGRRGK